MTEEIKGQEPTTSPVEPEVEVEMQTYDTGSGEAKRVEEGDDEEDLEIEFPESFESVLDDLDVSLETLRKTSVNGDALVLKRWLANDFMHRIVAAIDIVMQMTVLNSLSINNIQTGETGIGSGMPVIDDATAARLAEIQVKFAAFALLLQAKVTDADVHASFADLMKQFLGLLGYSLPSGRSISEAERRLTVLEDASYQLGFPRESHPEVGPPGSLDPMTKIERAIQSGEKPGEE